MRSNRTRAAAIIASAAVGITSVAIAAPTQAASNERGYTYNLATGKTNDPRTAALVKKITAKLPKNWRQQREAFLGRTGADPGPVAEQAGNYLANAACEPTDLDAYIETLFNGVPEDVIFILALFGVFEYPTYDALLFGSRTDPEYALTPGTTGKVRQSAAAARSLWDIRSGDIHVMGMDSSMVVDHDRVSRIIQALFGAPADEADEIAGLLIEVILSVGNLRGGDSPIFTLNAFAFTDEDDNSPLVDKIVMGEGIIKALRATGNIEVGPQMIFAHEFGHHVQYEIGAIPDEETPEATRDSELMADAFGAYLDAHRKGLNFNADRIMKASEVAHLVGDCSFDSPQHHGTPTQRAAAALWGANLAKKNGNTVLSSRAVEARFLRALPGILAN